MVTWPDGKRYLTVASPFKQWSDINMPIRARGRMSINEKALAAIQSPAVFDALARDWDKCSVFATAFGVSENEIKAAYDHEVEAKKQAAIEAKQAEARKTARDTWDKTINEMAFPMSDALSDYVETISKLAEKLAGDTGLTLSPSIVIGVNDDGDIETTVDVTGFGNLGRSGKRKSYDYYFDDKPIGRLKPFILEQFPSSAAAATIKSYDPKLGGDKKGSISSWDAVQEDTNLSGRFTRVERAATSS